MRTLDLTPLFRSTIGFDRLSRALDAALQVGENGLAYPPYNIEKLGDDAYRISMAVAGFAEDDMEIVSHESTLTIRGRAKDEDENTVYLHRGIAGRAFERKFQLADYIRVNGASLVNGMLHIDLVREVPEALKPHQVPIKGKVATAPAIERQAA
ncbi:small heat shock protein IbpA [uncultured Gammaproteobacteria bacterium]